MWEGGRNPGKPPLVFLRVLPPKSSGHSGCALVTNCAIFGERFVRVREAVIQSGQVALDSVCNFRDGRLLRVTLMVDGYCLRCRKPLGKVAWHSADFVFHRKCRKAGEVYTPPVRAASRPSGRQMRD